MKKSLFFVAAASALMLTACSSENDVVQNAPQNQTTVQEQAVGFDVYTPAATDVTRAGLEGTMTTDRMKRTEYQGGGFGVYAFQVQDKDATAGDDHATTYVGQGYRNTPAAANFMVNEKLLWNATNQGWYYNPLKYWPNETDNDSQSSKATMLGGGTYNHIDRLTFFAYAPYVSEAGGGTVDGITYITDNAGKLSTKVSDGTAHATITAVMEPSIAYDAALDDPNKAVDLLWGVAPAGGINYTAVNGKTVTVKEGDPLMDMTKPDVNTSMKFLFQHALARIGVTAVAAVDQVGAGGNLDPNTRITIEKITLTGYFGETGVLNLDNVKENVANWRIINGISLAGVSSATSVAATGLTKTTLTLAADHTVNTNYDNDAKDFENHQKGTIARHLQFVNQDNTIPAQNETLEKPVAQKNRVGVTTVRQNVIMPAVIDNDPGDNRNWYTMKKYAANELEYSETTPYYSNADCTTQWTATIVASDTDPVYTVDDNGVYKAYKSNITLTYPQVNNYYKVPFKKVGATITVSEAAGKQAYVQSPTGTFTPKAVGETPATNDYVIDGNITDAVAKYATAGDYYKRDANYFMVVPINNVPEICKSLSDEETLRTVTVQIEYYITTEDSKLADKRAQTKNVITKDVVFPSIANGKSYNLNLILGLTSVKMEAEVDDWKVINVQGDLPQNTAGE